jgi:outer membrane protein OmpA-like peptidoglycan-associated protein
MRASIVRLLLILGLTSGAEAQVSVDMRALDSLGPAQPAVRPAPARPVPASPVVASPILAQPTVRPPVAAVHSAPAATVQPANSAAAASASPVREPATVMPSPVVNSPTPALPSQQPSVAPPAALVPAPKPSPLPMPPPVRLVFEEGKTDLTPADEAAIRGLARSIPALAADSVNVLAYAAGKPDDPSMARRLSLSRGLAVRSILLDSGVPSAQIYVRALGATASDGPVDRVELTVAPIGTVTR